MNRCTPFRVEIDIYYISSLHSSVEEEDEIVTRRFVLTLCIIPYGM